MNTDEGMAPSDHTGGATDRSVNRVAYGKQIEDLRDHVVYMASMVDKAIARAVDALQTQDVTLAKQVRKGDKLINKARWEGEEQALMVIATQGPVASDLRTIAAAIQVFTDLERMGDHAVTIAKIAIETADEPILKPLVDIPRLSLLAREMLTQTISAFMDRDADLARRIAIGDDDVDFLNDQIFRELLTYMMSDPATINRAIHLVWAASALERVADRATYICERVVFTVTGESVELGGGRKKRQRTRLAESASGASG